ncbi:MAG: TonB-dependent receptor plug domain-containing protein, partial [Gammaproteobacteria bacterium]|nr:TonB-dependent receptor plug domain-containing protein [Gammaproteobacteria bacterium]
MKGNTMTQAFSNSPRALRRLTCTLLAAMAGPALAQQATDTATAGTESARGGLQEVVVTATRHEEALSRVPISVTALTQESMDQLGIKDFQDVARFTPGVNIDTSGTNAISIRGISSSGGAGTTGIYIDDTPIQMRSVGFNPDDTLPKTFDLQRVEILRGPQGTLFGAGSEGGAVRYILTPPSATAADTYVRTEGSYTQYGQPNAEFGIARGQPLVDGVF